MTTEQEIREHLSALRVAQVDGQTRRGHLRIDTGLLYPDGTAIEVFLLRENGLFEELTLSDLGQTTAWLLDLQVKPWLSKKRRALLEDSIRLLDVHQDGGALVVRPPRLGELGSAVMRLGQACLRVADLMFTRRSSLASPFLEEVEEVVADSELHYDSGIEILGRFGKLVRVDFLVIGRTRRSAVLTLTAAQASLAHSAANEVFRKWYDLSIPERDEQKITVYDDRVDCYRHEDLERINELSDLVQFSDPDMLRGLLAA
jgi:hypothetical protein